MVTLLGGAHSPPRRGGVARSAGVVSSAQTFRQADHTVCAASVAAVCQGKPGSSRKLKGVYR